MPEICSYLYFGRCIASNGGGSSRRLFLLEGEAILEASLACQCMCIIVRENTRHIRSLHFQFRTCQNVYCVTELLALIKVTGFRVTHHALSRVYAQHLDISISLAQSQSDISKMDESTPRINASYLESFQNQRVRFVGKVVQLSGDRATVECGGRITVILNRVCSQNLNTTQAFSTEQR